MDRNVHIVCPAPASHRFYGMGSLLYFELNVLHSAGARIILHLFGEEALSPAIAGCCEEIHRYPIGKGHKAIAFGIPFEVAARRNPVLEEKLSCDGTPVILYGWECSAIIPQITSKKKICMRFSGIPHILSGERAEFSEGIGKKLFHYNEARRIRQYEKSVSGNIRYLPFHENDHRFLEKEWAVGAELMPLLMPPSKVAAQTGKGGYCLYFGDFTHPEHERSAQWLIRVFSSLPFPFVLAGKSPSGALKKLAHSSPNLCVIENPSEEELTDLVLKSQIQVLPMLSATGIKSEIYQALLYGRHCLYHGPGFTCPLVKETCHKIEEADQAGEMIRRLFETPFHEEISARRNTFLDTENRSAERARQLLDYLFSPA